MFKPGQIAIKHAAVGVSPAYELALDYQLERSPEKGRVVNFRLSGMVGGKPVQEEFSLHGDVAYNFLHSTGLRLRKYGVRLGPVTQPEMRADFEKAYADLRGRLGIEHGQTVDLERFLRERP